MTRLLVMWLCSLEPRCLPATDSPAHPNHIPPAARHRRAPAARLYTRRTLCLRRRRPAHKCTAHPSRLCTHLPLPSAPSCCQRKVPAVPFAETAAFARDLFDLGTPSSRLELVRRHAAPRPYILYLVSDVLHPNARKSSCSPRCLTRILTCTLDYSPFPIDGPDRIASQRRHYTRSPRKSHRRLLRRRDLRATRLAHRIRTPVFPKLSASKHNCQLGFAYQASAMLASRRHRCTNTTNERRCRHRRRSGSAADTELRAARSGSHNAPRKSSGVREGVGAGAGV
ncbi:hypothetical protein MSAN_01193400 [Mycena sanguinolenta]|uniref:Uncharacterized protein n=1 Tax=Mycena sanguinolenta TaxID=230812 RepID=A0A8H6YHZ8_9AGAR|nr:hypothetical protein MSAN_01193400 [Mycena sanguinolenta]